MADEFWRKGLKAVLSPKQFVFSKNLSVCVNCDFGTVMGFFAGIVDAINKYEMEVGTT